MSPAAVVAGGRDNTIEVFFRSVVEYFLAVDQATENYLRTTPPVYLGGVEPVDSVLNARRKSTCKILIGVRPPVTPVKRTTPLPCAGTDWAYFQIRLAEFNPRAGIILRTDFSQCSAITKDLKNMRFTSYKI